MILQQDWLRQLPTEEIEHQSGDFWSVAFQSKVARVQQMDFGVRKVSLERQRARGHEDLVVLAPNRQQGWLMLAKDPLPFGVKRRVGAMRCRVDPAGSGHGARHPD